jgi:hypothetical protein
MQINPTVLKIHFNTSHKSNAFCKLFTKNRSIVITKEKLTQINYHQSKLNIKALF